MNPFFETFLHVFGWMLLWWIGLIVMPVVMGVFGIMIFGLDKEEATGAWGISLLIYLVGTAIVLIRII